MTRYHLFISVIASSLACGAVAAPVPATATLVAAAQQAQVVGDGVVWRCEGTSCTGLADARVGQAVATCTQIASVNGTVASFTAGATSFGENELKRCNRHVK